jgi:hypothetical protein
MDSRVIDSIVESLVTGGMGTDDFMRAVQQRIEDHEASAYDPNMGTAR